MTTAQAGAKKRLVLVDGHGLAFRAFFALPMSLATASGELTNATYGFTMMLLDALQTHRPDYVVVTFDVGQTFRHEEFEDYKAHRAPMPDELRSQIDRMRDVLKALNVPIYEAVGFEADDVIGTLSRQASEHGIDSLIVTGDSDMMQLVDENIRLVMPGAQRFGDYRIFDLEAVHDRYGFGPDRVIDYKALVGDKSDNVPGVPGIGDKTARKLIVDFGDIENMYANIDQIEPTRARNALANNRASAEQSKHLVTIVRDVPVELNIETCVVHDYDRPTAVAIFQELEFRSLLARLPEDLTGGDAEPAVVQGRLSQPKTIVQEADLRALAEEVAAAEYVAVDVETTGTDQMRCELCGIAIATSPEQSYYIPVKHCDAENADMALTQQVIGSALAEHPHIVTHNGKFDLTVLERHGFHGITITDDTMLAAYLLGEKSLGLKDLTFNRLGWEMTPITDLIGRGRKQITIDQCDVTEVTDYAAADVEATLRLNPIFRQELADRSQIDLLENIEVALIPVLMRMERAGIKLDSELLTTLGKEMTAQISEIQGEVIGAVGHEFNINSPRQLATVLFEEIGLPPGKRTKTGFSVAQSVLEGLRGSHEVIDLILEYRQLSKLQSTYVESLPHQVNPDTGRIHTNYNQTIAATGRLSSTDPNLQNIPVRTQIGRQVRRAFVADNDASTRKFDEVAVLFGADYSQMELRLMAHYSGDEALVEAFEQGLDIHATTAAEVFGVELDDVTPNQRSVAKVVNFGIMYGMQAWGLSRDTGMSVEESTAFIERYKQRFNGVNAFINETIARAEREGYAETMFGRRRYLPDIAGRGPLRMAAERAAINMPIQGTAADIMKLAMLEIDRRLREETFASLMLLQVHDELIFEAPESELPRLRELVTDVMANVTELSVPMEVDPKVGSNWEEMQPFDD